MCGKGNFKGHQTRQNDQAIARSVWLSVLMSSNKMAYYCPRHLTPSLVEPIISTDNYMYRAQRPTKGIVDNNTDKMLGWD